MIETCQSSLIIRHGVKILQLFSLSCFSLNKIDIIDRQSFYSWTFQLLAIEVIKTELQLEIWFLCHLILFG